MTSIVKFEFSKCFFAEFLCVSIDRISFVVMRYADEEDAFDWPAIKVKGIDDLFFSIEHLEFLSLSVNKTLIPAKIKKYSERVIFSTNDGAEVKYDLDEFRRSYMKRVVSSLIKEDLCAHEIPTIRKNRWGNEQRVLMLGFNKRFWSKLLHVSPCEISYGLLKAKYYMADEPDKLKYTELVPVLRIKDVSDYYFSIEHGIFFKPEAYNGELCNYWYGIFLTEYVPAKIVCSRDKVVFHTKNGEKWVLQKADIYRRYLTKVATNAILQYK